MLVLLQDGLFIDWGPLSIQEGSLQPPFAEKFLERQVAQRQPLVVCTAGLARPRAAEMRDETSVAFIPSLGPCNGHPQAFKIDPTPPFIPRTPKRHCCFFGGNSQLCARCYRQVQAPATPQPWPDLTQQELLWSLMPAAASRTVGNPKKPR